MTVWHCGDVPEGSVRSGAVPAPVEEVLDQVFVALGELAEAMEAIPEPAARVAALSAVILALDSRVDLVARARLRDLRLLRDNGWSYQRIALRTGLSKSRVAQLSRVVASD